MLCADLETCTAAERLALAEKALLKQRMLIHSAIGGAAETLCQSPRTVILAGEGEFLGRMALSNPFDPDSNAHAENIVFLSRELGPAVSRAACAHALVVLAAGRSAI
jgi:hypothetical protein